MLVGNVREIPHRANLWERFWYGSEAGNRIRFAWHVLRGGLPGIFWNGEGFTFRALHFDGSAFFDVKEREIVVTPTMASIKSVGMEDIR